nr:hypothetical protein [Streptococcus oricebi]
MKEVKRIFRNSCKLGLLFVFLLACRFWAQGLTAWLATGGMKAQFKGVIFSMLILAACLVGISSHYFSYEEKRVEKEGLSILDGLFILCFFTLDRLFLWLGLPVLEHLLGPGLVSYEAGLLATAKQISQQFFAAGLLYVMIISLVLPSFTNFGGADFPWLYDLLFLPAPGQTSLSPPKLSPFCPRSLSDNDFCLPL